MLFIQIGALMTHNMVGISCDGREPFYDSEFQQFSPLILAFPHWLRTTKALKTIGGWVIKDYTNAELSRLGMHIQITKMF